MIGTVIGLTSAFAPETGLTSAHVIMGVGPSAEVFSEYEGCGCSCCARVVPVDEADSAVVLVAAADASVAESVTEGEVAAAPRGEGWWRPVGGEAGCSWASWPRCSAVQQSPVVVVLVGPETGGYSPLPWRLGCGHHGGRPS